MNRITKRNFKGLNFDDTDRELQDGDYVHSLNLIPPKGGVATSAQRENVKGNTMIPNSFMPTGENVCIGNYEDTTGNRLIYFIWNSAGKHGIYQFRYDTNSIEKIFEWGGLGFSKDKKINVAGITDDLLYWSGEGQELRNINIQRALDGGYPQQFQKEISLLKSPPETILEISRGYDPNIDFNLIIDDSFQFAYRFVYLDNEVSILSDYSKLSRANYTYNDTKSNSFVAPNNVITVYVPHPGEIHPLIKKIEVFARANNIGNVRMVKTFENLESFIDLKFDFHNSGSGITLSDSEATKIVDAVPRISNSMAIHEGRIFTVADKEGFNVNSPEFTFTTEIKSTFESIYSFLSLGNYINVEIPGYVPPTTELWTLPFIAEKQYFKENGNYKFGIVFHDNNGRRSSVYKTEANSVVIPQYRKKSKSYSEFEQTQGPFYYENGTSLPLGVSPIKKYVGWEVSGKPPEWATKYSIVRTKELNYQRYFQFGTRIEFLYPSPGFVTVDGELRDENSSFYKGKIGNGDYVYFRVPGNYYIHIRVPENMPFVPDVGDEVRLLMQYKDNQPERTYKITNIFGQFIEVEPMDLFDSSDGVLEGILDNTYWSHENQLISIEIFTRSKTQDVDIYYEIGEVYDINNAGTESRGFSVTSGDIYGDTYYMSHISVQKRLVTNLPNPGDFDGAGSGDVTDTYRNVWTHIESPTPTTIGYKKKRPTQVNTPNAIYLNGENNIELPLDYSKIASDIGKPNVVVSGERERNRYTAIRYSNQYVQNSLINGYSSFDELNEYLLPIENGKIRKLVPAGNVLLAIHERATSSLYINEGFINTGDGQQFLSKTVNVVGDNRTLHGSFGTINPESVDVYDDKAYFYDMNKGEVLRYAENGLTPLASTFNAKTYFAQKSKERLKYKETAKVYGKFHPFLGLYILTFAPVGEFPGETIGFSEKDKRWITFFSFIPENYGRLNTELFSFKSGHLWAHERSEARNSFYGTSNNSELTFVCNDEGAYEKRWDNIILDSSEPFDVDISNDNQFTDLIKDEFHLNGSNWYAYLRRDKNTPAEVLDEGEIGLLHGWPIEGKTLTVKVKNNNNLPVTLDSVNLAYKVKTGQHLNERK